ncbi:hypothetical protein [Microlunatus soli]|uniref:ABC-type sugar transport system, permease component n=1 Tax=Microlunatus soli TaxID=630515 RepID=A0A1H1ZG65_9ACTN|nr:hypothetical protein [Microlunatus soli]SDT32557.1 hypothetical protein SAMN04489812_5194 [Microlunatus soli]
MSVGPARVGPARPVRLGPAWVGWLLLAPALVLMIVQLLVPGIRTVLISLRGSTAFGGSQHRTIGVDGYRHADDLAAALGGSLACAALLLVAALTIGPVTGLVLARATGITAVIGRGLLGLLLCCYAPTAMVLGLLFDSGYTGVAGLMLDTFIIYLPVAVAGSALLWSTIFRAADVGDRRTRPSGAGILAGAIMVGIACLAGGLQSFEAPVLLAGGRMVSTANLILYSLQSARFDTAAAVCTVLMIIVAALGLAAGVIMIALRARFVLSPVTLSAQRSPGLLKAVAVGIPLVIAVVVVILHRDWVVGLVQAGTDLPGPDSALVLQTLFNTWVPSGLGALIQVVVALLAGAAIGWWQPIGRHSRWLLLAFAPWLFAGGLPLIVAEYDARGAEPRSEDWTALIPSVWVITPAIFVLSWLFEELRAAAVVGRQRNPLPIVGAALLTLVICWIVQAQDLLRPMFLTTRTITAPMLSFRSVQTSFRADGTLWLVLPLPMLLSFAVVAAAALIMLAPVRLVVGSTSVTRSAIGPAVSRAAAPDADRPADHRHAPPRPTS